jgi:hypothetical protein
MPKRRALLLLGLMLALYPVSYLVVSRDGFYDPGPTGLRQGPGNTAILVSKFGYRWHPFDGFCDLDDFSNAPLAALRSTSYRPLLELDRCWWHTEERAESGEYPVKNGMVGSTWTIRTNRK